MRLHYTYQLDRTLVASSLLKAFSIGKHYVLYWWILLSGTGLLQQYVIRAFRLRIPWWSRSALKDVYLLR